MLIPAIAGVLLVGVAALVAYLYFKPEPQKGEIDLLDLASPFVDNAGNDQMIRLQIEPVRVGDNDTTVFFGDNTGPPAAPPNGVKSIDVKVRSLDTADEAFQTTLDPGGNNSFTGNIEFSQNGTWEIRLGLTPDAQPDPALTFYLLVPDPNINGFDSVPSAKNNADAEKMFDDALDATVNLRSLTFHNRLASGVGAVVEATSVVSDGSDGNPPVSDLKSGQMELLTIGDTTWQRPPGGDWIERTYVRVFPPSAWGDLYPGATNFHFGIVDEIDGIQAQTLNFYTPATDSFVAAWYTWWVDPATNHILQEVMTSQLHYMRYQYSAFDEPVIFKPPITEATPDMTGSPSPVANAPSQAQAVRERTSSTAKVGL